jgi:hypothetical protein
LASSGGGSWADFRPAGDANRTSLTSTIALGGSRSTHSRRALSNSSSPSISRSAMSPTIDPKRWCCNLSHPPLFHRSAHPTTTTRARVLFISTNRGRGAFRTLCASCDKVVREIRVQANKTGRGMNGIPVISAPVEI